MRNKLLMLAAALLMVVSQFAIAGDSRHRHRDHYIVGGALVGLAIGAAIANDRRGYNRHGYNRYDDRYGNRYGNRFDDRHGNRYGNRYDDRYSFGNNARYERRSPRYDSYDSYGAYRNDYRYQRPVVRQGVQVYRSSARYYCPERRRYVY